MHRLCSLAPGHACALTPGVRASCFAAPQECGPRSRQVPVATRSCCRPTRWATLRRRLAARVCAVPLTH
jgi:hypothetical protein